MKVLLPFIHRHNICKNEMMRIRAGQKITSIVECHSLAS